MACHCIRYNTNLFLALLFFFVYLPTNTNTGSMQSRLATYSAARASLHESILDTIGKTPIVRLQRLVDPKDVNVYVKLESENPGGSVKDRLAYGVIEWAEKHGHIQPGQTVVEASSGNVSFVVVLFGCL